MSKRDTKYRLKGCVEFDEGFFERVDYKYIIKEKESENSQESNPNMRGCGSKRQTKVLAMVE